MIKNSNVINTLRQRQNGRYSADDIVIWFFFLNENPFLTKIFIEISSLWSHQPMSALVHIMTRSRTGDKPLLDPRPSSPTQVCVTRSQWVNVNIADSMCYKTQLYLESKYAMCLINNTMTDLLDDFCVDVCIATPQAEHWQRGAHVSRSATDQRVAGSRRHLPTTGAGLVSLNKVMPYSLQRQELL